MVTTIKQVRPKRTPVGGARDILTVANMDPNYVYRWVNDKDGRITKFKEGGYEVVTSDTEVGQDAVDRGSKLGSAITKSVGGMTTAVLMRIPREWYDEDQTAKLDAIDALEATMQSTGADYETLSISRRNKR